MTTQPTMWNRFCAKMAGEVSADTLEAYRRASLAVYEALEHAETHRAGAKPDGKFKRAADGVYRWHLARAVPVSDANGQILKWNRKKVRGRLSISQSSIQ